MTGEKKEFRRCYNSAAGVDILLHSEDKTITQSALSIEYFFPLRESTTSPRLPVEATITLWEEPLKPELELQPINITMTAANEYGAICEFNFYGFQIEKAEHPVLKGHVSYMHAWHVPKEEDK